MSKQYSKELFKENLLITINEIVEYKKLSIDTNDIKIKIKPVIEENKKLNTVDDYLMRTSLSEKNLSEQLFDINTAVLFLVFPDGKYPSKFPIWINISFHSVQHGFYIFLFEISLRFRSQSALQNQETGHPPFKALLN